MKKFPLLTSFLSYRRFKSLQLFTFNFSLLTLLCFSVCAQSVRIPGSPTVYYNTIQSAYDAASTGDIIQIQARWFTENLNFNRDISITIHGGHNSDFTAITADKSVVFGTANFAAGQVSFANILLTGSGLPNAPSDTTPPQITNLYPANGAVFTEPVSLIFADFSDENSGIDLLTLTVTVDGVNVTGQVVITATGFTYTPAAALSSGTHTVTINIKDKAGNSAVQAGFSFVVDFSVQGIPTLTNAVAGDAQAGLTWTAVNDITGYKIKYGSSSGSYSNEIDAGNLTNYTITGLNNGVTYYFVVVAYNDFTESENSNEVTATPQGVPPPAPTLTAVSGGNSQVGLSWSTAGGATGYLVRYGTAIGSYASQIDAGNVSGYIINSLVNDTPYYFAVRAYNQYGQSSDSNELVSTPQAEPSSGSDPVACVSPGNNIYNSVQAAFDAATSGDVIKLSAGLLMQNLACNRDISIAIIGGYNEDFSALTADKTIILGNVHIDSGVVNLQNIILTYWGMSNAPVDDVLPTGTVSINDDSGYANSNTVVLDLSAQDNLSGVGYMQFSFDGVNWSDPEPYTTVKILELPPGDGQRSVSARFRDRAGNWSQVYRYDFILDTTAPQIEFLSPPDWSAVVGEPE